MRLRPSARWEDSPAKVPSECDDNTATTDHKLKLITAEHARRDEGWDLSQEKRSWRNFRHMETVKHELHPSRDCCRPSRRFVTKTKHCHVVTVSVPHVSRQTKSTSSWGKLVNRRDAFYSTKARG